MKETFVLVGSVNDMVGALNGRFRRHVASVDVVSVDDDNVCYELSIRTENGNVVHTLRAVEPQAILKELLLLFEMQYFQKGNSFEE